MNHEILGGLAGDLSEEFFVRLGEQLHGIDAHQLLLLVQVVKRDAPLESRGEQDVGERLDEVDRPPLLVTSHAQDAEADVVVHADDVGVGVMGVVVRALPLLRRPNLVPLPRSGVNLRVVHPIPLAVADVVADLHVLDDLGDRQQCRPRQPRRPILTPEQRHSTRDLEVALQADRVPDVARVFDAARLFDVATDGVEFATQRFDVRSSQVRELLDVGDGHRVLQVISFRTR